ncbi:MAG: amidase family protein [Alphaproteobacteria bacterium]
MIGAVAPLDLDGYMTALAERSRHVRAWALFLERYPIVLTPVSAEPPFAIGFDTDSAESMERTIVAQRVQTAVPLIGMPAASVPVGHVGGLPLGVHLIGPRFREDLVLDAAEVIEARHGLATPIDPVW